MTRGAKVWFHCMVKYWHKVYILLETHMKAENARAERFVDAYSRTAKM